MPICHVTIIGRDRPHLVALGRKLRVIVVGYREDKRGAVVDAYVPENKIDWLRRNGCEVKLLERIAEHDRERQKQKRAAVATRIRKGRYGDVIWGGGYLGVDEVETALALGEKNNPGYVERIPLPHRTWEKRRCHALRIGKSPDKAQMALCLISGVHGREWGGPDILIYFGIRLLKAYREGTGVRLGSKSFSAAQIRSIIETRDLILFPQVNPDGRNFSMDRHPMWRKNRRPAPKGRNYRSIGVDLNRNFPFMWDFERYFAPNTVASTRNPTDYETYVGPRPASEPETRNVIWLLDQYPNIQYFVDLHSYGETILHSWSGDENQSDDPAMNFANPAYDGKRGKLHEPGYREYIPAADEKLAVRMGQRMAGAIEKVRGRKYQVQQSVGLYPTAAATDDYAYSRHLLEPGRAKTISYTVEFGRSRASTPFHPPYPEMRKVMREITAGLLELCLRAEPV
jgi:carboxypeptidase T